MQRCRCRLRTRPARQAAFIGTGRPRSEAPFRAAPIPLQVTRKRPETWISVGYNVYINSEQHLTVLKSFCMLSADSACEDRREKTHGYPEAHLQVYGDNEHLMTLCGTRGLGKRPMHKLHVPVGGRRYRPALEDILEFLIVEDLVDALPDAQRRLNDSRKAFRSVQVRAAVRDDPRSAADVLETLGYHVTAPR